MNRKKKIKAKNKMIVIHQKLGIEDFVQIYNFFGGIIGVWAMFYPKPFELAITMSMIVALLGFVIMFRYIKSVELFTKESSRPHVGITILFNSTAFWITGFIGSNTIYSTLFWIYFAACCLFLISLMAILKKYYFKNIAFLIILVITISIFSMGIITNVNYLYDNSNPIAYYSTSILEKDVYESGKMQVHLTVNELLVSHWGNTTKYTKVAVPKEFYNEVYEHEEVKVCLQSGLLGIKWYYLEL